MKIKFQLFFSIIKMEIRSIFAYPISFWINFLGTTFGQLALSYFLWSAIFLNNGSELIGGMNFATMILYSLLAPMTVKTIMGMQMLDINQDIYTGGLNKYIIYPVNYFQFKWTQQLTHTTSRLIQLFVTLFFYTILIRNNDSQKFEFLNIILFIINIFISSTLFFVLEALMEVAAFWAENVWSLSVLLRFLISICSGAWLSLTLFPNWAQTLLHYLPFKGMVYTPVKMLMGEMGAQEWGEGQIISIVWILIIYSLFSYSWNKGKVHYSGVGI